MGYRYTTRREDIDRTQIQVPATDVFIPCERCGGTGHLDQYRPVNGGTCFACDGIHTGYWVTPTEWVEMEVTRLHEEARAEERRQQKLAKRDRDITRICAARPVLAMLTYPEMLHDEDQYSPDGELVMRRGFLGAMSDRMLGNPHTFTTKQLDAAADALVQEIPRQQAKAQREADREAAKRPAPEGRAAVRGTIRGTRIDEDHYGYQPKITFKMLVECPTDDGGVYRVWSTIPAALLDATDLTVHEMKGCEVEFTATLVRGNEDSFAIAKRPSKAKLVSEPEREPEPA